MLARDPLLSLFRWKKVGVAPRSVIKPSPFRAAKEKPSAAVSAELLGTLTPLQQEHQDELCVLKATAFGFRNCSSKFFGRFDPESDGFIAVHQRLIGRVAVGGTTWELW